MAGRFSRSLGTVQSRVMLEKGAWVPQRLGVLTPKTKDWMHCLTSFWVRLSTLTKGAKYVSKELNA